MSKQPKVSVIVPVNDGMIFEKFCGKSSKLTDNFVVMSGAPSAAAAFNYGMKKAKHDICLCCHQDVFFPPGWIDDLVIPKKKFGVLGLYGVDMQGNNVGHIHDPHGYRKVGIMPAEAQSVDELCIIIDRRTGLEFDEALGGWHFYGADICLQAITAGLKNYVIDNLVIHASGGVLDNSFGDMLAKFTKKWDGKSPIKTLHTTCTKVFL